MFCVEITDEHGTHAEFSVVTPVTALDLALNAERAGLRWHAHDRRGDADRVLPLDDLRRHASRHAEQDPGAARQLRLTEAAHVRGTRAGLN